MLTIKKMHIDTRPMLYVAHDFFYFFISRAFNGLSYFCRVVSVAFFVSSPRNFACRPENATTNYSLQQLDFGLYMSDRKGFVT